jgi:hypothetical protein
MSAVFKGRGRRGADRVNGVRNEVDMATNPNPGEWRVTQETQRLLQHWHSHFLIPERQVADAVLPQSVARTPLVRG